MSTAAKSDSPTGRTRRARKYAGSAASDIATALIVLTAAYACGSESKSRYAGAITSG